MIKLMFFILLYSCSCYGEGYNEATNKLLQIAYKETGTEKFVTDLGKDLDKRYVSDSVRPFAPVVMVLLECSLYHQVGWKWTF